MHNNQRRILLSKQPGVISRKQTINESTGYKPKGSIYQLAKQRNGNVKLCIIRSVGGLGDVLMTMPAVRQMKETFPNCHMTYACDRHTTKSDHYYQIIKNAPFIDNIIDARYVDKSAYDGVVDISSVCIRYENAGLPTLNRIDIFARACGIPRLKNPVPFYKVEPREEEWAANLIAPIKQDDKKIVLLHTASFDVQRSWPANRMMELLQKSLDFRPDIHYLVSDFNKVLPDKDKFENVTDVSKTDIRELAALIDACDLFLGPDSGPMHLAGALKQNAIVMFGSIPPQARINYYKNTVGMVSEPKLSCLGCWYKTCHINFKCMKDISADRVFKKLQERL